jgi:type II secretory pathway component PulF
MPRFTYKAVTPQGAIVEDKMEAANAQAVAEKLQQFEFLPLKISAAGGAMSRSLFQAKPKVKGDEVIVFTRQLVTLLKAGVPLLASLEALVDQTDNKSFQEIIKAIYKDIESGISFSEALGKHPKIFSPLYISSIRAGEFSGALDDVLERLSELMEHDRETRARVKAAMRYPIIVIVSMVVAFFALMLLVVPKFIAMFEKAGLELPLPTRALILIYNFVSQRGYWLIVIVAIAIAAFKLWVRTENGRYLWDGLMLKVPIFGPLILKTAMSRFTRMFETLNSSGLPILQTLDIVSNTVGNAVIGREIQKASLGIRQGEGIAVPLKQSRLFPPMVVRMISIGEQSGSLDEMLLNVSKHYDAEVEYAVKNLTSMIEPILTVGLGAIVLFLALAIFLPMWDLTKMARR